VAVSAISAASATGVASGSPSPTDDTRSPGVTPATATVTPPTHTPTIRPTATRTPMPSITPDLTGTAQAVNLAVETLIAQRLTEVAASWTDIPSPTIPPPPTRTPYPTATATESPTPEARCTLPERMQTNQGGRTTLDPDALTSVRAAPDLAAQTLRRIPPGQMFWVTGGPVCTDSVAWWAVEGYDVDGRWSGWIGEGRDGTYWIEPYDTGPIDCPGAKPPRMTPGEQGRITLYPDLPSRIRSAPHITDDSTILGKLDPGTTFEVISGPVCKNGYRWWYVDAGRYQGWVAEGDERDYWIEPWS
jgi:hypothetical protein